MYSWKKWIWPGVISVVILTAIANWFKGAPIEAELTDRAMEQLSADHPWASVALDRRDLVLRGTSPSPAATETAIALAEDAYGVRIVRNETEALAAASPYKLGIQKTDSGILLTGNAPDHRTRAEIVKAVQGVAGAATVDDQLELAAGAPAGFAGLAAYAAGFLPTLENGNMQLEDTNFSVSGLTATPEEFADMNARAENLPEGYSLASNGILPPPAVPYRWSVAKRDDGITLRGNVPSAQARSTASDLAKSAFGNANVVDRLTIASGEPEGLEKAQEVLMQNLARLDAGQANLVDNVASISGRVEDDAVAAEVEAALASNLPEGFTASTNILVPAPEPVVPPAPAAPEIPTADPFIWSVSRDGSAASVSGNVSSEAIGAANVDGIKSAFGIDAVSDKQTVALGAPAGIPAAREFVLNQMTLLDEGRGNISGTQITVSGTARDQAAADQIAANFANAMPAGFSGDNRTRVAVPVANPYRWSVNKSEAGLAVFGNVISKTAGDAVVENLKAATGVSEVTDNQTVARGRPIGFADARNAVTRQLRLLDQGQASIVGKEVKVSGTVKNRNLIGLVERGIANGIPEGYTAEVNVTAPESEVVVATPVEVLPPVVDPYGWSISKRPSGVTVAGNVASDGDGNGVVSLARSVTGAADVTNRQTVARGKPEGFDKARDTVIRQMRLLDEGQGTILGKEVRVTGSVKNRNLIGIVERGVTNGMPEGYTATTNITAPESEVIVAKPVEVLPDIANPYRWSVSKTVNGVTVRGNVESEAASNSIASLTADKLGVNTVSNKQTVARGKPEGFDAAQAHVLDQVNRLEAGQGNIIGNVVSVTGRAPSEAVRNAIDSAIVNGSPAGFTGSTNIVFPKPVAVAPKPEPVEAKACQQNIVAAVNGRKIQFETARAVILQESRPVLDDVIKVAQQCPEVRFQIAGHTDSRGRDAYNQGLSEARANAVVKYMTDAGVDVSRLEAKGFGEAEPIADNNTPEGRTQNRRIEFRVLQ